ncbi:hypothetical protein, partial [Escherichia coli]|uniref:hypothetical protein n=1 Tax=Escherichia coli TaxID=562 RepID=UPI001BB0FD2D
ACIFLSFLSPLTVWSVSVSGCFYCRRPVAVLSKVVELAGVIPPPTRSNSITFNQFRCQFIDNCRNHDIKVGDFIM